MSNETKKQIAKAAPNRWLVFCILTFSGGIAFKLSSMKDMFYVPMQEFMGLSNTQIGAALSVYGIVQTIGLIAGIYICDIISKKYMIGGLKMQDCQEMLVKILLQHLTMLVLEKFLMQIGKWNINFKIFLIT